MAESRSRSPTPSRSRSRSPPRRRRSRSRQDSYSDSYTDYSDSLSSLGSAGDRKAYRKKSFHKNNTNASVNYKGAKGAAQKGKKNTGRTSKAPTSPRGGAGAMDTVTKRMLSARRIKINELRNETEDLNKQLTELRQENKMLRRSQRLQEKALERVQDQENDMGTVLQRHSEEVRTLKEHLRKHKEKNLKVAKKLRDTDDELERTKRLLRKMTGLVEDKELKERDTLSQKLSKAEADAEEKDKRVRDLERHSDNLAKNHKHEIGIERARHRETERQLKELRQEYDRLQTQMREKEKEQDMIKNIYSLRLMKPPHRLNSSVSSTPNPGMYNARPPRHRKASESSILTPREKAREFERRRREEERRKREEHEQDRLQSHPRGTKHSNQALNSKSQNAKQSRRAGNVVQDPGPAKQRDLQSSYQPLPVISQDSTQSKPTLRTESKPPMDSRRRKNEPLRPQRNAHYPKPGNRDQTYNLERGRELEDRELQRKEEYERDLEEKQDREKREKEEQDYWDKKEKQRREEEEEERRRKREDEENERKEMEADWKEERERRKRESDVARDKEEQDRRNRDAQERRERQERDKRDREERERRDREDQERRDREEREREERLRREQEDRERRDREEREEQARRAREDAERSANNDKAEQERRRQKDLLLAKMKAIDDSKKQSPDSSPTTKKEFVFTQPIENMHNGKPAYDNVTVPVLQKNRRRSLVSDSDSDGGYQPSFLKKTDSKPAKKKSSGHKPRNNDKKSNLMDDLFGDSSKKSTNNDDGIMWGSASKKRTNPGRPQESSTMLFAGGTGIVDSDGEAPPRSNAHLLPRRQRQTTTAFQARPAVNAVDDFDDDIEEVAL